MHLPKVKNWKKLGFLLVLVSVCLAGRAQIYPVQVSTQLTPPYDVYLPDYASPGGEKLRIVLLQRDLTIQGYRLRFEMKIQVNGLTIMQTSKSAMPPPITLQPGIPTVLGGTDLNWYVQPQNLEFGGGYSASTYEQTRALPEGPVTITFTAYDYVRSDVQVSLPSSTFFYATLNNPPLLNYPACGMAIPSITPQFLNFNWLPQNTSSPNSALQTNYIFSLWQVLPAGYSYQDIVQSAQPLFTTTVQQPNFVYGPAQPMLVPGQQYAWRVQAVDASGRDIFGNNGYSQTCNFTYSGDSSQGIVNYPVIQINAVSAGSAQGKAWWSGNNDSSLAASGYTQYELYYHKSQGNYDWDTAIVSDTMYRLFNLEPATSYECRLQGYKGGSYGPYSGVVSFTTDSVKSVSCTAPVSMLNPSSGQPLASATPGMTLTYGPWNVQLLTVQPLGGPGQFKGTCSVTVPFMGGMSFNASFTSLTIDDSRNVTAGTINFLSQGTQAWIDSSINNQMGGSMYGKVVSGTDATNVTVPVSLANLTQLPVSDSTDGSITSFTIPGTPPIIVQVDDDMQEVTIKDSTGSTYALDNQGNLTQLTLADGSVQSFFANPQNVASLDTLATGMGVVNFVDTKGATFAFDSWKPFYAQASAILTGQYEKLTGGPGNYYVPQKAIGAGASDIVGLDIDLPDNMDEDSLVFATGKGVRLIWDPTDYNLNLLGGPAADAQEIYALYPKPGGGYYSLGKLLLSAYEEQDFTAVLVPVMDGNGNTPVIDAQHYSDSLNSIYNKVNVNWTVQVMAPYTDTSWDNDKNALLTMSGSSFLSNSLVGEPAALVKNYTNSQGSLDNTKKYIFILNSASGSTGEIGSLQGDMPRGTQYGFIFLNGNTAAGEDPAVTVAHELGHGQFNLEHTFSGDIALGGEGATSAWPNLMDYQVGNYLHLYKYQWNQIHQPGQVLGIFENDSAAMSVATISGNAWENFNPLPPTATDPTFIVADGIVLMFNGVDNVVQKPDGTFDITIGGTTVNYTELNDAKTRAFKYLYITSKLPPGVTEQNGEQLFTGLSSQYSLNTKYFTVSQKYTQLHTKKYWNLLLKRTDVDRTTALAIANVLEKYSPQLLAAFQDYQQQTSAQCTYFDISNTQIQYTDCWGTLLKALQDYLNGAVTANASLIQEINKVPINRDSVYSKFAALTKANYCAFGASDRLLLLSYLVTGSMTGSYFTSGSEVYAIDILENGSTDSISALLKGLASLPVAMNDPNATPALSNVSLMSNLDKAVDDGIFGIGGNNYTTMMTVIKDLVQQSPDFQSRINAMVADIGNRVVEVGVPANWNTEGMTTVNTADFAGAKKDQFTFNLAQVVGSHVGVEIDGVPNAGGMTVDNLVPVAGSDRVLGMFDLVLVRSNLNINLTYEALGSPSGTLTAVPALMLKYLLKKQLNQDIQDGVFITLDMAGMATGVGELGAAITVAADTKTAIDAVRVGVRAFTLANSAGNFLLHSSTDLQGTKFAAVVNASNLLMAGMGVQKMIQGGATILPQAVAATQNLVMNVKQQLFTTFLAAAFRAQVALTDIDGVPVSASAADLISLRTQLVNEVEAAGAVSWLQAVQDQFLDIPTLKGLQGQVPTGSKLTGLSMSAFATSGLMVPQYLDGQIKDLLASIMANGDANGSITEQIIDLMMEAKGYQKLIGKYNGSNGFDGVYIPIGDDIATTKDIIIMESKQFKQGVLADFDDIAGTNYAEAKGVTLSGPSKTTQLPGQMSQKWIAYVAGKLSKDPSTAELGDAITKALATNPGIITKFVNAVDKSSGNTYFLKLDPVNY